MLTCPSSPFVSLHSSLPKLGWWCEQEKALACLLFYFLRWRFSLLAPLSFLQEVHLRCLAAWEGNGGPEGAERGGERGGVLRVKGQEKSRRGLTMESIYARNDLATDVMFLSYQSWFQCSLCILAGKQTWALVFLRLHLHYGYCNIWEQSEGARYPTRAGYNIQVTLFSWVGAVGWK